MRTRRIPIAAVTLSLAAASLSACDRSVQNADGATNQGELGVAATTANTGVVADTGRDTGAGPDVGGAGELGAGGNSAATNANASGGGGQ